MTPSLGASLLALLFCQSMPVPEGHAREAAASEAARFTAVVVFPTPPFWFATAMTLPMMMRSRRPRR